MKRFFFRTSLLALFCFGSGIALAQNASLPDELTSGEIRKVDQDNGKITIKHDAIKNLDMPAMTMVFQVKDKSMLAPLKADDKIRFHAINQNGKMTVTQIEAQK